MMILIIMMMLVTMSAQTFHLGLRRRKARADGLIVDNADYDDGYSHDDAGGDVGPNFPPGTKMEQHARDICFCFLGKWD